MMPMLAFLVLALLPQTALAEVGEYGSRDQCIVGFVLYSAKRKQALDAKSLQTYCACQTYLDPDSGDCPMVRFLTEKQMRENFDF